MAYVSVDVDVEIEQFDDEDVLLRALEIIQDGNQRRGFRDERIAQLVRQIRLATNLDEDTLPPPSTASKIVTEAQLKAFLAAKEATQ